jgi:5-methylthioadenosine/S-adenosylhomocysteine deaminase
MSNTKIPRFLLVRGGRILDPDGDLDQPAVADILIKDERIAAVGSDASTQAAELPIDRVVDARNMLVAPGFVNAHYHSHDTLLRGRFEQMPLEIWGLLSFPQGYPRRSETEVRVRTLVGAVECLRSGITTTQDMVTIVGPDRPHLEAVAQAYRESGIRVVLGLQFGDLPTVDTVPFYREFPEHLQAELGGARDPAPVRRFIDDALHDVRDPRLTWGLAPSGPQRCSEDLLRWFAGLMERHELQVFTHVYEARSQAVIARVQYAQDEGSLIAYLDRMGLLGNRLTIAHGVWIEDREVERFGRAGANLAFNPMSNLKLMNGVAPIRRYAEAGAGLAVGCDNCSGNDAQNIFESMKMFALYWAIQGRAGETGAAREAFRAATLGGARALGLAGEIGRIHPDYRADLTLIDLADPSFVPLNSAVRQLVYGGSPRAVHTVIVAGEIVVENGDPTRIEESDLVNLAAQARSLIAADFEALAARSDELIKEMLRVHERVLRQPLSIDRFDLRLAGTPTGVEGKVDDHPPTS